MALVLNDRVKETTTGTGTGTVNLAGAEVGFETFVAGIGNTNTTYYAIVHQTAAEFEVGLGTVSDSTPDTLSRTTILSSSNSDSAVNFSAGTKDVFCTLPASKTVFEDASDNIALGAAPTVTNASGDLTLDVVGDIILDANGGDVNLKDDGTTFGGFSNSSSDFVMQTGVADKDILFQGTDGSSLITALTLDMSDAGTAIFNHDIKLGDSNYLIFGAGTDFVLHSDGQHAQLESGNGNFIVDCNNTIKLDADDGEIQFLDAGTEVGIIDMTSSNFGFESKVQDKDIIFKGNDGGSTITALTLDMSENGNASFSGTVNAGLKFIVNAWNADAGGRNRFYFANGATTYFGTGSTYAFRNSSDVDVFIVDGSGNGFFDGNVTAYYSDERLKDKQGKIENALDKVGQIETFYFKENELAKSLGHTVDKKQVGVSAQSVYEVLPEIVDLAPFDTDHETGESKSGEDYMTVDYAKLTPLLIEAIKELQAKVKKLEDK